MDSNGIRIMSWPVQSPVKNIVENLWLFIKKKLQGRVVRVANKVDLFREVHGEHLDLQYAWVRSKSIEHSSEAHTTCDQTKTSSFKVFGKGFFYLKHWF